MRFTEQFKKFAQSKFTKPGEHLPIGIDMLTGSLAGGIAGAITTPLDVMKTLLQTQQSSSATLKKKPASTVTATAAPTANPAKLLDPPVKHYSGIMDGMIWNYKNQGLAGLFRGIGPRVFWTSLQSAIMFVVYEQVLHVQSNLREIDEWPPTKIAEKFV